VRTVATCLVLLLVSQVPISLLAQDDGHSDRAQGDFFSGTITVLTDDQVTVLRTVLGKNSETRTFAITKQTRVEGKLRPKVRVTVRFVREEDVDQALHIIVRTIQKK
jgi:hypothetical protein